MKRHSDYKNHSLVQGRIKVNRAECALCHDIIESKHRHDFVSCKCGEIFVDGGMSYLRRGANNINNLIERSEYE